MENEAPESTLMIFHPDKWERVVLAKKSYFWYIYLIYFSALSYLW